MRLRAELPRVWLSEDESDPVARVLVLDLGRLTLHPEVVSEHTNEKPSPLLRLRGAELLLCRSHTRLPVQREREGGPSSFLCLVSASEMTAALSPRGLGAAVDVSGPVLNARLSLAQIAVLRAIVARFARGMAATPTS